MGSVERIRSSRGSLSRSVLLSLLLWQLAGGEAYLRGWSGDGRRRACRAVVRVYQGPSSKTYLRSQKVSYILLIQFNSEFSKFQSLHPTHDSIKLML